jgi:hypothetical protein
MGEMEPGGAAKLKEKLEEWRDWMNADDPHAIWYQIASMVWDHAVYRVINECRRLAPPAKEGGPQLNGAIHTFIDLCHFRLQPLAIRRLTEINPREKKRYVISLRRLLDDIRAHAPLVTRGVFFEAAGLPYDYSAARVAAEQDERKRSEEALATGKTSYVANMELENRWTWAYDLHAAFDRFSRTTPSARRETDQLNPQLIDALGMKLDVCRGVSRYVDKRVAHAADPRNRDQVPEEARELSLARIEKCHRAICSVASFLSVHLLRGGPLSCLAWPRGDVFAHIDKPWVCWHEVARLQEVWDEFHGKTEEWSVPEWPDGW